MSSNNTVVINTKNTDDNNSGDEEEIDFTYHRHVRHNSNDSRINSRDLGKCQDLTEILQNLKDDKILEKSHPNAIELDEINIEKFDQEIKRMQSQIMNESPRSASDDSSKWNLSTSFLSKSLVALSLQFIMSAGTVIFSFAKLSQPNLNPNEKMVYIGLITSNVGLWSPSPYQSYSNTKKPRDIIRD